MSDAILPPNATPLEIALDRAAADLLDAIPNLLRTTDRPQEIPIAWLPWLAWGWDVEDWSSQWSERQKRNTVEASYHVHRTRGTVGAIRRALQAINVKLRLVEWFEDTPNGQPYTFRIEINPEDNGLTQEFWSQVLGVVNSTKNVRSHLAATNVRKTSKSITYHGGATSFGLAVNIPAEPFGTQTSYHAGAVSYGLAITVDGES